MLEANIYLQLELVTWEDKGMQGAYYREKDREAKPLATVDTRKDMALK